MSKIKIGAQGWNYDDWVGPFYPRGTRASEYLDLYQRIFDTVEVDSTFYAIPAVGSIETWFNRAPDGFSYSLKLPKQITHELRLQDSRSVLAQFCDRAKGLGEKLAVVLIQLPPDFTPRSIKAFERFLPELPSEIQFAVEFRDRAWLDEPVRGRVLGLLSEFRVALALVDSIWIPGELSLSLIDRPTARFAYLRWMGRRELTEFSRVQINRDREFAAWAEGYRRLKDRVDLIYGYFNNFYQGHSPASCNQFKRMIGQPVIDPDSLVIQPSLF